MSEPGREGAILCAVLDRVCLLRPFLLAAVLVPALALAQSTPPQPSGAQSPGAPPATTGGRVSASLSESRERILRQRLSSIRTRIQEEERKIQELRKSRGEVIKERDRLIIESNRLASVRTDLLKKLTTLEAEEDSTSEFIGGVSERLATERERFRKRVVEVYRITRRNSVVRYLATAQSVTDLLRRTHYLRAMAERDRQVLMQLYTLATDLAAENQRLAAVRAERLAAVEQTKGLERQIEEQQKQKLSLLKTIEERTRQEGRALESLRQNASELETMLAGLMGGESVPSEPALASGEGLLPLRGRLSFPVSGKLVQGYGKHGHGEFSETVFVKGLEVAGVEGGKVKAVAAGRVAFSQQFPMLGHVVIVDHGERYYSLYGRLIGAFCSVGQVVKGGEEIGVLGALDKRGRNFYFEVRLRGKAVDPAPFFASLPRS